MIRTEQGMIKKGYYTHSSSAYEQGTNERMNGMIRKFVPKGKEINQISKEAIKKVQDWYNRLPRRIFNYKNSMEKFVEEFNKICRINVLEELLVAI